MIRHVHELFRLAPSLRRWSYYCFYCLQATLVLLANITDCDHDRAFPPIDSGTASVELQASEKPIKVSPVDDSCLCEMSVQIFQQIELKASKRCAEHVHHFLEKWKAKRAKQTLGSPPPSRSASRLPSEPDHWQARWRGDEASPLSTATEDLPTGETSTPMLSQQAVHSGTSKGLSSAARQLQMPYDESNQGIPQISDLNKWTEQFAASGSVAHTNDTSDTSPMSLGVLQADLYDTLYRADLDQECNFMFDDWWSLPNG